MTTLYGKDELKETLDETARKGRLSHAIMFSGRKGSGKKVLARYTARLFLCENHACGNCPTCRNIDMGAHPDVIFVREALGGKYSMEPLKEIIRGTVVKPNNGDSSPAASGMSCPGLSSTRRKLSSSPTCPSASSSSSARQQAPTPNASSFSA